MKSLILFVILVLTSIVNNAQIKQYEVTPEIIIPVSEGLCDEFDDFIIEYKKAGLPLEELKKINGIYYSQKLQWLGLFGRAEIFTNNDVLIATDIPRYLPTLTKMILYHEIGHILMHPLMHSPRGSYITRPGNFINIEYAIAAWPALRKDYITTLKIYLNLQNDHTEENSIRYIGTVKY